MFPLSALSIFPALFWDFSWPRKYTGKFAGHFLHSMFPAIVLFNSMPEPQSLQLNNPVIP